MIKSFLKVAMVASLFVSASAFAQSTCGGHIQFDADTASNPRQYAVSCCPEGYRVQGIAYNDLGKNSGKQVDAADAFSAVCRSVSSGEIKMASEGQTNALQLVCDPKEVLAGIICKDLGNGDESDGCTIVCQTPGSSALRQALNADTDSNRSRPYSEQSVLLPKRIVGIASKDMTKGGHQKGNRNSDESDGAAIIVK